MPSQFFQFDMRIAASNPSQTESYWTFLTLQLWLASWDRPAVSASCIGQLWSASCDRPTVSACCIDQLWSASCIGQLYRPAVSSSCDRPAVTGQLWSPAVIDQLYRPAVSASCDRPAVIGQLWQLWLDPFWIIVLNHAIFLYILLLLFCLFVRPWRVTRSVTSAIWTGVSRSVCASTPQPFGRWRLQTLTLITLNYFGKTMETEGFFQFEIITNVLVSYFRFIWIPMLWVYRHYKYFISFGAGNVFICQNLTSTDVRFWRIKTVPALKGLIYTRGHQTPLSKWSSPA